MGPNVYFTNITSVRCSAVVIINIDGTGALNWVSLFGHKATFSHSTLTGTPSKGNYPQSLEARIAVATPHFMNNRKASLPTQQKR